VIKKVEISQSIDAYNLLSILAGTEYELAIRIPVDNLQKLLVKKEEMLYEVTPNSESIKNINFQIDIQKKLLVETIQSLKQRIKDKVGNLQSKTDELRTNFYTIPENELEFAKLQRLYGINEKYYILLLEKKTEYSISKEGNVSKNIFLETPVVPKHPVSPDKTIALSISIAFGIFSSLLLVFIIT
jgi:tyrosine-protein kinase Etk/Wzc